MLADTYDPDRRGVIDPFEAYSPLPGFPEICIGIFSRHIVEETAARLGGEVIAQVKFCTGAVPVYRVRAGDTQAALFLPHVGGPAAASFVENLIPWGGRYFVFSGSCGVLRRDISAGHLILPTAAVRDEGLSYHYLPPAEEIVLDPGCVAACRKALERLGFPFVEGKTWTTDGFFRETRGKVRRRKEQGCLCVEMECASLAAVARFRGAPFAQFFWSADNLDAPEWDARDLNRHGASVSERCFAAALETGKELREHFGRS